MKLLCFLGPPASGKGSYTKLVLETLKRVAARRDPTSQWHHSGAAEHVLAKDAEGQVLKSSGFQHHPSARLYRHHNLPVQHFEKVVASDLIKKEMREQTVFGKEMQPYMERHEHVPSELMVETLCAHLEEMAAQRRGGSSLEKDKSVINHLNVLLDGFPRSVDQAEAFLAKTKRRRRLVSDQELDGEMDANPRGESRLSLRFLHLDLKREWARAKAVGRLVCPDCDFPYNDAEVRLDAVDTASQQNLARALEEDIYDYDTPYTDTREEKARKRDKQEERRVWSADLPPEPKCGRKPGCGYPNSLIRRDSAEVFDHRYEIYLKTEFPVVEYFTTMAEAEKQELVNRSRRKIGADATDLKNMTSTENCRDSSTSTKISSVKMTGGYRTMCDAIVKEVMHLLDLDRDESCSNETVYPLEEVQKEAHLVLDEWEQ
ncbi:unnamed protein product [Amoebophrya sp. A120]|nr:unnamed protein product [Amoebophrya sp. A120]|eukprot:GSA120T00016758001.1